MKKYIISPITTYDEDNQLFETKIGVESEGLPLHYSAWGKSEETSRQRAQSLTNLLNEIIIAAHP